MNNFGIFLVFPHFFNKKGILLKITINRQNKNFVVFNF
jgi:hypothetical protein